MNRKEIITFALSCILLAACFGSRLEHLLSEAEDSVKQNRYEEARKLLERVIDSYPESSEANRARYRMGVVLETYFRDPVEALHFYEDYLKKNEDPLARFEVLKKVGNLTFQGNRNLPRAIDAYAELVKLRPKSKERDFFVLRQAEAHLFLQQFTEARSLLSVLSEEGKSEKEKEKAKFEIANSYYLEGKYEAAIEAFNQYLRKYKNEALRVQARFLQAQSYDYLDKPASALEILQSIEDAYQPKELISNRIAAVKKKVKPENVARNKKN